MRPEPPPRPTSPPPPPPAPVVTSPPAVVSLLPGDKVLVAFADTDVAAKHVAAITDGLRARFPGVEFTLVAGVSALAVQRGSAS